MKENQSALWAGLGCIAIVLTALLINFQKGPSGKFQIVFCDVGQGDAIYLKTPKGRDILVDGGPNEKVMDCLSRQMPFWDRTIEMVVVSHPQADHITGLIPVFKNYKVDSLLMGIENNEKSPEYKELVKIIREKNILLKHPFLGQKIDFSDGVKTLVFWPEKKWLAERLFDQNGKILGITNIESFRSQNGDGRYTFNGDLNQTSTVLLFQYGNFEVFLTGDADSAIQPLLMKNHDFKNIEVLKIPHHGSKKALADRFLEVLKPKLAVISVGKNSFGHPSKEIIKRFEDLKISMLRTDLDGEIKIESDGEKWSTISKIKY